MINFEAEKIRLIDISGEDDFLIDSHSDNSSLDLRLSVACENENALLCSRGGARLSACPGEEHFLPFSSPKEQETFQRKREEIDSECSVRKSLAWDNAFFTDPGFLELEELCLVNRGLKNPQVLSCGSSTEEVVRSKICMERNSSNTLVHKPALRGGSRLRTHSLINQKMASPSKVTLIQDSKPHYKNTRSSATPRNTNHRRESPMSRRRTGQNISATPTKKSPCKTLKGWENPIEERLPALKSRRPDSLSVSSILSSQSAMSLAASRKSFDFSPRTNCSYDAGRTKLKKSPMMQGECPLRLLSPTSYDSRKTTELEASLFDSSNQGLTYYDVTESQNSESQSQLHSPYEQLSLDRRNVTEAARSSKPSSLRMPSQTIGFFHTNSEASEPQTQGTCPEFRNRYSLRSPHSKEIETRNKLKDLKSKREGLQASLNQKSATWNKGKICRKSLETSNTENQRKNQHKQHYQKQTTVVRTEEKENMFHPEDTVIELEIKKDCPSPPILGAKVISQCSSSSGKHPHKPQRSIQQTKASLVSPRIPFSIKGSPLKRSAFF